MLESFIRARVSFLSLAEKLEGAERELPYGPWVSAALHPSDRGARLPGTLVPVHPAAAHRDAEGSLRFISRSLAGWKSWGRSGASEGNEAGRAGSGVWVLSLSFRGAAGVFLFAFTVPLASGDESSAALVAGEPSGHRTFCPGHCGPYVLWLCLQRTLDLNFISGCHLQCGVRLVI